MNKFKIFLVVVGISVVMAVAFLLYRTPSALKCTYEAKIQQSVPSDLWRFNWLTSECQYFNGTRWIPLKKVVDVGSQVDE